MDDKGRKQQYRGKGDGVVTYDNLSRGRKQQIDFNRRKKLKEAKDAPKSRAVDLAADVLQGVGRAVHGDKVNPGAGSERARYKANREKAIREAQDKADYKDVRDSKKYDEPLYFTDSSTDRNDQLADKGPVRTMRAARGETDREFKKSGGSVKGYKSGGKVRGDGIAVRGKTKGRTC